MRKQLAMLAAAGAVGAAGVSGAFADSTTIQDPEGDASSNNIDIVSAKAGHAPGKVLKHRVTVAKKVNPNDIPPSLRIDVPKGAVEDYVVRTIELEGGPGTLRGGVFDANGGQVGKASITAVGENGWKYKFREKAIGKPKRYGWAFAVTADDATEILDRAPDTGYVKHRLGR